MQCFKKGDDLFTTLILISNRKSVTDLLNIYNYSYPHATFSWSLGNLTKHDLQYAHILLLR